MGQLEYIRRALQRRQALGVSTATELGTVLAAAGIAQNLGALRALATVGIQQGHMKLHAKNLAVQAGALSKEVDAVVQRALRRRAASRRRRSRPRWMPSGGLPIPPRQFKTHRRFRRLFRVAASTAESWSRLASAASDDCAAARRAAPAREQLGLGDSGDGDGPRRLRGRRRGILVRRAGGTSARRGEAAGHGDDVGGHGRGRGHRWRRGRRRRRNGRLGGERPRQVASDAREGRLLLGRSHR